MGLDMTVYKTRADISAVDFPDPEDSVEVFYWRKHPDLHGWFQELYDARGGIDRDFNCSNLQLTADDLDLNYHPGTTGFFFGATCPEHLEQDEDFKIVARQALAEGFKLYYSAWW